MIDLRKAAEMALNALQAIDDEHPYPIAKHAIVQISKALAQPEKGCAECGVKASDGYALYCVKCTDLFTQPEQEPVAWMYVNEDGECEQIEYGVSTVENPYITLLYADPPSKPWVSLTDEDMGVLFPYGSSVWVQETVKIIEAKLKEKNNG